MTTHTPSTQNPTPTPAPEAAPAAPTAISPVAAPTTPTPVVDVQSLVEKARAEEKNKLYPEMERLKAEREAKEKEAAAAKAEAEALKAKMQEKEDSSLTEQQKLEKRLAALEASLTKVNADKEQIAASANQKVAELELRLYREQKVREAGIELVELVQGSTQAEIDASIARAREREAQFLGRAKDRLREDVAKELGRQLPTTPAAPTNDDATKGGDVVLSPQTREQLSKIRDKAAYQAERARLLAEAKSRIPDTHPLKLASRGR